MTGVVIATTGRATMREHQQPEQLESCSIDCAMLTELQEDHRQVSKAASLMVTVPESLSCLAAVVIADCEDSRATASTATRTAHIVLARL